LPEFRGTLISLSADAMDVNGRALVPVAYTKDQYVLYFAWSENGHVYVHVDNSSTPGGTHGVVFDRRVVVFDQKAAPALSDPRDMRSMGAMT
jgi:hypothetical protein